MDRKSSIDKLDEQINMLKNHEFVDKPKTEKIVKKEDKPRKVILEEETVKDDLMSDLVGDNEKTKVFAQSEIDKTSNTDSFFTTVVIDSEKFVKMGKVKVKEKDIFDVYLPIFLIMLILFMILGLFLI